MKPTKIDEKKLPNDIDTKMLFLKVISIAEQYCEETNIMERIRSNYCIDWGKELDWE